MNRLKCIPFWRKPVSRPLARGCALLLLAALCSTAPNLIAQELKKSAFASWERSLVTMEVARRDYDYYQPWVKRTQRLLKTGLVLGDNQLLSTADGFSDRTLVRVQKGGRGSWWTGEVTWVDYHANLALVRVTDPAFWKGLKAAPLGSDIPSSGSLQVLRWRDGNLENRSAEFTRFSVQQTQLSQVSQVALEADSDIQNVGWGEPLVANSRVVGLVRAREGRNCVAIPVSIIQSILEARARAQYHGLGYFHFFWQTAENPAVLTMLGLTNNPRGVVVVDLPPRPDGLEDVLRPHDILLNIDGFDLDVQGDYHDPEFGPLSLEALSTRHKWAGDTMAMQVWRDGKALTVHYKLPRFEYTNSVVPGATFDREPEYVISGGLVFQPLTVPYLRNWGPDWRSTAPFRLRRFDQERASTDRPALVLLSQVLPDPYNIGFQDLRSLTVDKINGRCISRLSEVREALLHPVNGFHIIDFMPSDSLRRMVLAAGPAERAATQRVLSRYGIAEEYCLSDEKSGHEGLSASRSP